MANKRLGDEKRITKAYSIDPEVARLIEELAYKERRSASFVASEILRKGLRYDVYHKPDSD